MTQIIMEDPDLFMEKEVDGSGRLYLGTEWADKNVKVAIQVVHEDGADPEIEESDETGNQNPEAVTVAAD